MSAYVHTLKETLMKLKSLWLLLACSLIIVACDDGEETTESGTEAGTMAGAEAGAAGAEVPGNAGLEDISGSCCIRRKAAVPNFSNVG